MFQNFQSVLVLDGEHEGKAGHVVGQSDEGVSVALDLVEGVTVFEPAQLRGL